jgi:anti-sigma factor RsiW
VTCREATLLQDAYLDNELGRVQSLPLQQHLAWCTACRERLADRVTLGRLVRSLPYHAAPDALRTAIATARTPPRVGTQLLAWAAAVTMAVSLGGATAVRMARARQAAVATASIVDGVVGSHVRALTADHLFDVRSSDEHTVKPWFLGKLDFSPPVEDLGSLGFPLIGGRVDDVAGEPVAALVYRRRLSAIDLFICPDATRRVTEDVRSVRGFQLRHWSRGEMSFWAISDLNDAELAEFERALRQGAQQ